MSQTAIQNSTAVRKGAVKVEIGDDFASLVNVGALRNPQLNSKAENQAIKFDNVDDLKKFVNGKKIEMAFDLCEINLTNLATLDAGLVALTTVAGTPTAIIGEALGTGWVVGQPIKLANKNGADTEVATIVIDAGGTPLVLGTDYNVFVGDGTNGELGYTFIVPVTAQAGILDADYSYTPNASKNISFNDSGVKTSKVMRITNTDENGKEFRIDIENATNFAPISIDFAGDEEEDVAVLPITFEGDVVEIVDQQNTV
jgi:hypothetical protein